MNGSFPSLANDGDDFGIWSDFTAYSNDKSANTFDGADAAVSYSDDPPWPFDDGQGSIYLSNLGLDSSDGANWLLSADADGLSFHPGPAIDTAEDHAGGDVGSPGSFPGTTADGDFDDNGLYECADVDPLVTEIVAGTNDAAFDLTGDGVVNSNDLTAWLAEAGTVLTASGNPILGGDANLDGTPDGRDFVIWNANKFTDVAAWCSGDFNADGTVDGQDFLIWNANKFQMADHVGATVPEPTRFLLWGLVWSLCGLRHPNRHV